MWRYLKIYIFIVPARLQESCNFGLVVANKVLFWGLVSNTNLALGLVFTIKILVLVLGLVFFQDQDSTSNQDEFCSSLFLNFRSYIRPLIFIL